MIEKKKILKDIHNKSDKSIANQNSAWDKDNQAWWDWYVSLADNSNSNTNDNLLELPELPKRKYPSKIDIKQALSRPFNLSKHNITTFQKNGFIKLKNVLDRELVQALRCEILLLLKKTFRISKINRFWSSNQNTSFF